MKSIDTLLQRVNQATLEKPPEEMLKECLSMLIELSAASGGSILGEEGAHLAFLFSDMESLINIRVPWESIAGTTVQQNKVIYTYAPSDKRHYDGIDSHTVHRTKYLLSIPIPSVHQQGTAGKAGKCAGALQLLFEDNIFPNMDVTRGPKEFTIEVLRQQTVYEDIFKEIIIILPGISFGLEIIKLRQTYYQAIHEVKNKLFSAASWIGCLKQDLEAACPEALQSQDVAEDIELAERSVREGAELAKSCLNFTKIYIPNFVQANMNDALGETADSLKAYGTDIGLPQLEVARNLSDKIVPTSIDPNQLKMAFFNLGKNAVEALHQFAVESPCITVQSYLDSENRLVVQVGDNGPGMPPEIAENLFIPFKTKKQGGTGLGLTISKKIFDIHGGTITCSTSDRGTSFKIIF